MADSSNTRNAPARQHTPGPWLYRPHQHDDWGIVRYRNGNGYPVAVARPGRHVSDDELGAHRAAKTDPCEANARLIAAAPELAAMVRELKLLFQSALLCTTPEIAKDGMVYVRKADALLAKAEGR